MSWSQPEQVGGARRNAGGFTLIELVVVLAILAALSAIAIPAYQKYVERTRLRRAEAELRQIEELVEAFELEHEYLPASLADIGANAMRDPWSHPYRYLRLATAPAGASRKDKFLVPLNTDYDLYSMGPDGSSQPPLTAQVSRDDIVRANDGAFLGPAADY